MHEVLLTEVKVRQHKLYHHFRGLGGYFKAWNTIYHTKALGRKGDGAMRIAKIRDQVARNPRLAQYQLYKFQRPVGETHFDVMHLVAPPGVNEIIRKKGKWKHGDEAYDNAKLPKEFVTGHYTEQARQEPCAPWRFGVLEPAIEELLTQRNAVEATIRSLEAAIEEGTHTRRQKNVSKVTCYTDPPEALHNAWLALADNAAARGGTVRYVMPQDRVGINDEILALHLPKGDYFMPTRVITPHELHQFPWLVFDTESPLFQEGDQTVTWIPYAVVQNGAIIDRAVLTTNDVGSPDINSYRVIPFVEGPLRERAERMTRAFAETCKSFMVLSAYNASYDLPTLRDMGGFRIGNDDSEPKKEVTTKFFERIGVRGKLIIDPMRIARMACPHLVNAKADNVLPYLLGTTPFKELAHDDLGQLEHLALGHEVQARRSTVQRLLALEPGEPHHAAARIIGRYAVNDVEFLAKALLSKFIYQKILHAAHCSMDVSSSDYGRLLHLPSAMNEAQNRRYKQFVGLDRTTIYLPTTTQKRNEAQARGRVMEFVQRSVNTASVHGLHEDVWQCRLPIAEWIGEFVGRNFPQGRRFFKSLKEMNETGGFWQEDDPLYRQFLNTQGDALCKLLVADTGMLLQAAAHFNAVLGDRDYVGFVRTVCKIQRQLEPEEQYDLRKRTMRYQTLRDRIDAMNDADIQTYVTRTFGESDAAWREFYRVLVHAMRVEDKEAKVAGNYAVYPDEVLATIETKASWVGEYAKQQYLCIVHADAPFVYVRGNERAVKDRIAPWIALEKLPLVYVTDHLSAGGDSIFFKQNGFYKGLKRVEHPSWNVCVAEAGLYIDILQAILDGEHRQAARLARDGLERFVMHDVKDDFLFTSKSSGLSWYFGNAPGTVPVQGLFDHQWEKVLCRFDTPEKAGFINDGKRWVSCKKVAGKEREYQIEKDAVGRLFYREPVARTRRDTAWNTSKRYAGERVVWFLDKKDVVLDMTQYAQRVQQRLVSLLTPVMKDADQWLRLNMSDDGERIDRTAPLIAEHEYLALRKFSTHNQVGAW